ncbi:hypothetical protein, partial [Micromonospora sp. BL4]|uniref:hypothetical protein n=1 Tax=Micromonospora sp. BL4 TaxID=2478710 RepID=UPI001F2F3367
MNRSGPRLAYRMRTRWTTGACPPSGCGFLLIVSLLGTQLTLIMKLLSATRLAAGNTFMINTGGRVGPGGA